ncbi:hypothetical protein MMC25_006164 [Agyrium rufum]|nr:hypothetical protein [Agyrium rufum]
MANVTLPAQCEDARVTTIPDTCYYMPNFLSEDEEQALLAKINSVALPTWRQLKHRRLQTYPSPLTPKNVLLGAPLPSWLTSPVIPRLFSIPRVTEQPDMHLFSESPHKGPNHVLINEYEPGQGIMPHEDGGAYHPMVATVSLGSSLVLDIYAKKDDGSGEREAEPRYRILQEPRSLLITTGPLYEQYLHGIAEVKEDVNLGPDTICNWSLLGDPDQFKSGKNLRSTRISLTYRDVLKVANIGNRIPFLKR